MDNKRESRPYGDRQFGALIREARQFRRVSQLELGRAAGVSEALIGAIERGVRAATPEVKAAIASRLGITFPETNDLAEAIKRLTEVYEGTAEHERIPGMTIPEPYWAAGRVALHGGDALAVLASLPTASVDAVITDPPYSSGGMTRGDRADSVHAKYVNNDSGTGNELAAFAGDNRDQRSYGYWCALWLGECLRITKPGGACLLFTDWRQLPATTDAFQAGGWVWRGIVPWSKPGARPQTGRFRAECEYVVWGSAGPMGVDEGSLCLPGFFQALAPRDREHIAQKPLSVMRDLVKIAPKGGTVLDPFMGAGTTGIAAVLEARAFIGAEVTAHYQRVARERIEAAVVGYRDDGAQLVLGVPA